MKDIVEYLSDMRWDIPGPIRQGALDEIDRLRSELATKDAEHFAAHQITLETIRHCERQLAAMEEKCRTAEWSRNHERADNGALRNELAEAKARIVELEDAGKELHRCLVAMVNRWEPDTEGLDRVMWENACEALGRDIWAHLKTT